MAQLSTRVLLLILFAATAALAACERPQPEATEPAATETEAAADEGPKVILVTGATGTQGGAVARELLNRGYIVRAFTRDPESDASKALAELGAQPVQGDFDDPASIAAAMDGAYGVFAVPLFWQYGYDKEVEQGKRLIDEAERTGVKHFVLTSVAAADESTGIPHFDSKWEIEQYLHASELDWTIVRPVEFMDNWRWSVEQFRNGQLIDPREADSSHQWIASSDIGFFVGEAFDKPEDWTGLTQEIAGDEMTVGELRALLSEVFGTEVEHVQVSWEEFEAQAGEEVAVMYRWFEDAGYSVEVAALRARYPGLVTARQFLQAQMPRILVEDEEDE